MAVNNIHMILDCDVMLSGYVGSRIGAHIEQVRESSRKEYLFRRWRLYPCMQWWETGPRRWGGAFGIIEAFLEKI